MCILRRLEHPHVIALRDAFVRPSATGRYVYRRGRLTATSIDLYLATEYCDRGDLFGLRGQLSEAEARGVVAQLLSAVRYLHAHGVWHRDIKVRAVWAWGVVRGGEGEARDSVTPPARHAPC